jgi:predicted ATPase
MFSNLTLENLAAFQKLEWQQHERINLIIGENDTGKTHLLKILYCLARSLEEYQKRKQSDSKLRWQNVLAEKLRWTFQPPDLALGKLVHKGKKEVNVNAQFIENDLNMGFVFGEKTTKKILKFSPSSLSNFPAVNALFIPPKEILTVMEAIDATRYQLEIIGFDDTYIDLIRALRLPMSQGILQKNLLKSLKSLNNLMGNGRIDIERNQFIFKRGFEKYSMSQTAEGVKKVGILSRLIRNRLLNQGSILFMDEPETNLHPKAIVSLVDLLFNLAQIGVQIYIATHSYFVLKRFELLTRQHNHLISVCSLSQTQKKGVTADFYDLRDGMPPNPITDVSIALYEQDVKLDIEL